MGYIILNFFDVNEEMRIDGASKKTFVITIKNIDTIFDLDPRAPFNKDDSNEDMMFYKRMDSATTSIVKVTKLADRSYNFTYCELSESEASGDIQCYNEITLKPGQVRMLQSLCEFAMPALPGLHAVYNPDILG